MEKEEKEVEEEGGEQVSDPFLRCAIRKHLFFNKEISTNCLSCGVKGWEGVVATGVRC